jgi:hypothetical protein
MLGETTGLVARSFRYLVRSLIANKKKIGKENYHVVGILLTLSYRLQNLQHPQCDRIHQKRLVKQRKLTKMNNSC